MFRLTAILALALLALPACEGVGRPILGQSQAGVGGAESRSVATGSSPALENASQAAGGSAALEGTWGTPRVVIPPVEDGNDQDPFVSSDGLSLYFSSLRDESSPYTKIWRATRLGLTDPWGEPAIVEELVSEFSSAAPHLSDDGLRLWIARSDGADYLLHSSTRSSTDAPWSEPVVLGGLGGNARGLSPSLTADERVLYFNRASSELDVDIYRAERASTSEEFGTPEPVEGLNSSDDDWDAVSWDDLSFVFSREGELLRRVRDGAFAPFGDVELFFDSESDEDSDNWDFDPWVSTDGNWVVYASQGEDVWAILEVRRE